jgi:hypothetical protein
MKTIVEYYEQKINADNDNDVTYNEFMELIHLYTLLGYDINTIKEWFKE